MKGYDQVIFTHELLHHRTVGSQIEETRRTWQEHCSWFPAAQRDLYSRYAEIYDECLRKYGNNHFEFYAKRNRLNEEYRLNTQSSIDRRKRISKISMDHLKDCKASRTSNAEYGRIRPMQYFYCF
ncbi:uncharacterized protein LOC108094347 [Drosophila ficusphila]|uniref:uncharacterized protein LOC108094347 n=1 Tax=Drosophila ficusphila TaxID=30025 RepID=UPI0007E89255|nr:uncharacterized protein LOC108094347 [Drosophila ficusphila]